MLSLPPESCLVVEDAVAGAQAAHAGGFLAACVGDASKSARAITISPVFPTFFPSAIGFKKEEPHEIRPGTV